MGLIYCEYCDKQIDLDVDVDHVDECKVSILETLPIDLKEFYKD